MAKRRTLSSNKTVTCRLADGSTAEVGLLDEHRDGTYDLRAQLIGPRGKVGSEEDFDAPSDADDLMRWFADQGAVWSDSREAYAFRNSIQANLIEGTWTKREIEESAAMLGESVLDNFVSRLALKTTESAGGLQ